MKQMLDIYHRFVAPKIDREIERAASSSQEKFPEFVFLPDNYGKGMTERVVEILVARLTYGTGKKILDVGHSNVTEAHLRMLKSLTPPLDITGIDITPATDAIKPYYTRSVVGNVINTNFPDNEFDLIWCISAIEHFGMDNSIYTDQFTLDTEMDKRALEEMMRILKVGGTIYISIPFGKFEDHGWLKNYDKERWDSLLSIARPSSDVNELYFEYSDEDGWRSVKADELSNTGYSDHQNAGASGLAVALIHKLR